MNKVILILAVFLNIPFNNSGQSIKNVSDHPKLKIELISGNPKLFEEAKNYYILFDYSGLQVEEYGDEQAYIDYMKDDADKRKKGSSDSWLNKWYGDRNAVYQPKFIEILNKYLGYKVVKGDSVLNGQEYVLKLHTKYIDIGFNKNFQRSPAYLNVIVTISEIKDLNKQLVISMTDIPGDEVMGSYSPDFRRIEEAYAKCGKELAQYMSKVIY
jgi:hypothetical protein